MFNHVRRALSFTPKSGSPIAATDYFTPNHDKIPINIDPCNIGIRTPLARQRATNIKKNDGSYITERKQSYTKQAFFSYESPIHRNIQRRLTYTDTPPPPKITERQAENKTNREHINKGFQIPTIVINSPDCHNEYQKGSSGAKGSILSTPSVDTPNRGLLLQSGLDAGSSWKILGKGSFGTVVQAKYKQNAVAVKVIPCGRTSKVNSLLKEELAVGFCHANVVAVLKVVHSTQKYGIVIMELCANATSLQKALDDACFALNSTDRFKYTMDIANALQYIHHQGVMHLDVKPSNILLCFGHICKLCDFGTSAPILIERDVPESYEKLYQMGTTAYMAPEVLMGHRAGTHSDVFSFGVTMWQLLHRQEVYTKMCPESIIYQVVKYNLRPATFYGTFTGSDLEYIQMYTTCWDHSPSVRPCIWEIIKALQKL